ncbi:MAG: hypothetical protein AABX00_05160 [Nanoarchaeota archaeon]
MNETIYYGDGSRYIYPAMLLSAIVLLLYSFLFRPSISADFLISIGFFAILYYIYVGHKISGGAFLLGIAAITVNLLGAAGLYAHFAFGAVGYDKLVHLISSFAAAYALLEISTEKQMFLRYTFVILMLMGLGALVEINEFIGTAYFGMENGGIFAIGDGLSVIKSDLQRYDTYFDMITNLLGGLMAVSFVMARSRFERHQSMISADSSRMEAM